MDLSNHKIRAYEQVYSFRIDIREDQLTIDGIVDVIQDFYQQTLLRPTYLLMNGEDVATIAKRHFPEEDDPPMPTAIAGISIASLPNLERGTAIAGLFEG